MIEFRKPYVSCQRPLFGRNRWHDFKLLYRNIPDGCEQPELCHQWTVQVRVQGRLAVEQIYATSLLRSRVQKPDFPPQATHIEEGERDGVNHLLIFGDRHIEREINLQNHVNRCLFAGASGGLDAAGQ